MERRWELLADTHSMQFFRCTESRSKLSQMKRQLKKVAQHLGSTLPRPPIYDQASPETSRLPLKAIQWAPGTKVRSYCATRCRVFGTVDKGQGNIFVTIFGNQSQSKDRSKWPLKSKLTAVHIAYHILHFMWHASLWGKPKALHFGYCKKTLKIHFLERKLSNKLLWKIRKLSANDWRQLNFFITSPNFHSDARHGKIG